jgi:methyl-accepting chemotaxis protein
MNRHSIRQRLTVLLLMPLASLLFYGGSMVRQRYREASEMDSVSRLAQVSVRAAELLHHTQRERGLSAGFMGATGNTQATFRAQLIEERKQTDAATVALAASVAALGSRFLLPSSILAYGEVNRSLQRLPALRAGAVDSLEGRAAEVVETYTDLDRLILAMVAEMSQQTSAIEIGNRGAAFLSLMQAKETLGIERSVLMNTFSAEGFGPGMYRRVAGLSALEESHLSTFRVHGGPEAWRQLQEIMQGEFVTATAQMREAALASGGGTFTRIDPKVWFKHQTAKMEAMRKVEAWLARDIVDVASGLASRAHRAFTLGLAAMVVIVLCTLLLGALVVRSIVRPLGQAVEVLGRVAAGDFTNRLETGGHDEVGRMATSLNQALVAIHQTLGDVRQSSLSVSAAARETAAASEKIERGARKQAASLQETAAAVEEITVVGRRNSENAVNATQLAGGARDVAEQGRIVVSDAVRAMEEITAASKRITDIVTVIDEIAFNTNLLALNAAIEAGRAGEHGRGFAVVAAEVGDLAGRCSTAASEIKGLIEDSARKVEAGTRLVNRSGQMLAEIVGSARRVTDIVTEIAAASREQALGVEQINKAIMSMEDVTEGNARQTGELSATAEELAAQAQRLLGLVARFRLTAHPDVGPPVVLAAAPVAVARPPALM